MALKAKYGSSVKLDLSTYQEDTGTHKKGESMKDDDEMWLELARLAEVIPGADSDGAPQWTYIANAFTTDNKPEWENNPLLYTKSSYYYMPEEL